MEQKLLLEKKLTVALGLLATCQHLPPAQRLVPPLPAHALTLQAARQEREQRGHATPAGQDHTGRQ